ncbi:MAG: CPBP family intramembrane metalloprotease [Gammaproteobacteria bacterium]|nr:CPBP family intramembrane metalloprotease [Gammaproteobacteria bacterium]MYL12624.1 CPBP family intramembrane metalloprotease [Gammaproteobacteria bacterium]
MLLVIFFSVFLAILFPIIALSFSVVLGRQGHRWFTVSSPALFAIMLLALLLHLSANEGWDSLAALEFNSAGMNVEFYSWIAVAALIGGGQYLLEKAIVMQTRGQVPPPFEIETNTLYGGLIAFLVLVSVIAEELIWRAYLIPAIAQAWGVGLVWAALVAAFLFGVHHVYFGWQHLVFKAIHGIVWTAIFWASGSLWTAIVAHAVFNYCVYFLSRRNFPINNSSFEDSIVIRHKEF